jgi:alkylated DNA repair protein alkB homolog 1
MCLVSISPGSLSVLCTVSCCAGLLVYPNLLPPSVQLALLDRLLHRDLSNPQHATNVQLHYHVPCPPLQPDGQPTSYFDPSAEKLEYPPKASHSAIDTHKMLDKKLRWVTLGGQYDWTNKVYPPGAPPGFPPDIKRLIQRLYPAINPEAAICNVYSPGDTLAIHRDVSEECANPLVSISLGCESIFVAGVDAPDQHGRCRVAPIHLRSGDAVVMMGEARWAWHGVAKVMPDTCPKWMEDWPAVGENAERYQAHKGWMKGKRVNLNVRQMFASEPTPAPAPAPAPTSANGGGEGSEVARAVPNGEARASAPAPASLAAVAG